MRVLATLDLPPQQDGGIATLTDVLATGLHEIGEPVVVYARGRGCEQWDRERPYPIVRMRGHSWVRHPARNFAPYVAHIRARHADAQLYLVNAQLGGAATRLAQRTGSVVVALVHGLDVTAVEELSPVLHQVDRVVATTHWMRGELTGRGLADDRIGVAAPGVHPPSKAADPAALLSRLEIEGGPLLLCVGRLVRRKGHDTLIRALPEILRVHPSARLLIVGQGRDRQRLEALAEETDVGACVLFGGFLEPEELEAAYQLADLFVLPCREERGGDTEGFGLVFVEAGARGLAVIGGRTAGVVEAIEEGKTGLLVDPADIGALASAVSDLLTDGDRARSMGEAGRRRALEEFSPAAYARRIVEAGP